MAGRIIYKTNISDCTSFFSFVHKWIKMYMISYCDVSYFLTLSTFSCREHIGLSSFCFSLLKLPSEYRTLNRLKNRHLFPFSSGGLIWRFNVHRAGYTSGFCWAHRCPWSCHFIASFFELHSYLFGDAFSAWMLSSFVRKLTCFTWIHLQWLN